MGKVLDEILKQRAENERREEEIVDRVKAKLRVDWSDEIFQHCVFRELEKAGFKRLSFLSDILENWDLAHLTGYPALLGQAGLRLDRETDEIQFYKDLFKQLDREKLLHFLAWAVVGEELNESVIDNIVPSYTDEEVRQIIESWDSEITDNVEDCPNCHILSERKSAKRQACLSCAKQSLQTRQRILIPSMWRDHQGDTTYLCKCASSEGGQFFTHYEQPYDRKCDFHA